jgi:RNA polymerase sigma factor (sigma-70 family)
MSRSEHRPDPDDPDEEIIRRLEVAVERMPCIRRKIFLAHRLDGLSYDEIASRTGLSVKRVERHMAKALLSIDAYLAVGRPPPWWRRWFGRRGEGG